MASPTAPTAAATTGSQAFWRFSGMVVATGLAGYLDYATGRALSFFVFYFIPVGVAGWHIGTKAGIGIAVLSAFAWAVADFATGYQYEYHLVPVWNMIIRLVAFLVIGLGAANLRHAFEAQESQNRELSRALSEIRTLEGLLPICASCKDIRDEEGHWQKLESYIVKRVDVSFSHGVCPDCAKAMLREAGLSESLLGSRRKGAPDN